jgi:hypothetical protein
VPVDEVPSCRRHVYRRCIGLGFVARSSNFLATVKALYVPDQERLDAVARSVHSLP